MSNTMPRRRLPRGQTLVEFALVLPMLLILIANVVNFGGFFFDWITVQNAARSGAQYFIRSATSVGIGQVQQPDPVTQVAPVVRTDMLSLLKSEDYSGWVCQKTSGPGIPGINTAATVTCTGIGQAGAKTPDPWPAPADDPSKEAWLYQLAWVDIAYTYQPIIPLGFQFPRLGLYVTLPNDLVIHRRVMMRVI